MNRPTRQTQPYRSGVNRAPSQTLDKMLAGRGPLPKPGAGAELARAMVKPTKPLKKPPVRIPY
jgi:hypothetical protein